MTSDLSRPVADTILGRPYIVNQAMPVIASVAKSVLFGDFSNYKHRAVKGTQMLRLVEVERLLALDAAALKRAAEQKLPASWAAEHFGTRSEAYRTTAAAVGWMAALTPAESMRAADSLVAAHRDAAAQSLNDGHAAYLSDTWRLCAATVLDRLLAKGEIDGT